MNDLDEQLGYDADHDDPSQYCIHGTWVGSWWGPDYLCSWCEAGVSVADMEAAILAQQGHRLAAIEASVDRMLAAVCAVPSSTRTRALTMCTLCAYLLDDDRTIGEAERLASYLGVFYL